MISYSLIGSLQGIYARAIQGNASAENAASFGNMVEPLASAGLKLAGQQDQWVLQAAIIIYIDHVQFCDCAMTCLVQLSTVTGSQWLKINKN